MTIPEFIAKWRKVELNERSAAQEDIFERLLALNMEEVCRGAGNTMGEA
jgi:hypothetical protein